jgi:hypothetical protein
VNKLLLGLKKPRRAFSYLLRRMGLPVDDYRSWASREYSAPSPPFVKQRVVRRNGLPNATWVETGTYLGDTTSVLSRIGSMVYSIEPEPSLFANARKRFAGVRNVEIINGLSEDVLPALLPQLRDDVCFWLDGHYSAGLTSRVPRRRR